MNTASKGDRVLITRGRHRGQTVTVNRTFSDGYIVVEVPAGQHTLSVQLSPRSFRKVEP